MWQTSKPAFTSWTYNFSLFNYFIKAGGVGAVTVPSSPWWCWWGVMRWSNCCWWWQSTHRRLSPWNISCWSSRCGWNNNWIGPQLWRGTWLSLIAFWTQITILKYSFIDTARWRTQHTFLFYTCGGGGGDGRCGLIFAAVPTDLPSDVMNEWMHLV